MALNKTLNNALPPVGPAAQATALYETVMTIKNIQSILGGSSSDFLTNASEDIPAASNLLVLWCRGLKDFSTLDSVLTFIPALSVWCDAVEELGSPPKRASAVTRAAAEASAAEATISLLSEMVHTNKLRLSLVQSLDAVVPLVQQALRAAQGTEEHALLAAQDKEEPATLMDIRHHEVIGKLLQDQLRRLNDGQTLPSEAWRILLSPLSALSLQQASSLLELAGQAVVPKGLGREFFSLLDDALGKATTMAAAMKNIDESLVHFTPEPGAVARVRSRFLRKTVDAATLNRLKGGPGSFILPPGRNTRESADLDDCAAKFVATAKKSKDAMITGLGSDARYWLYLHACYITNGLDDGFLDDFIARSTWTLGELPPWSDGSGSRPILDEHGCGLEDPAVLLRFRAAAGNFQRPQREQHLRMSALVAAAKATAESAKRVATSAATKKN